MKKNRLADFIKHAVDIESYGNSLVEDFKNDFKELYERIINEIKKYPFITSKEKYNLIIEAINEYIAEYYEDFDKKLDERINDIVTTESAWLIKFMAGAGVTYTIAKNIKSNVKFMPVGEYTKYTETGTDLINKISKNVSTALKNAYLTKESTEAVSERFANKYEKYENYFDAEMSTFNTAIFRNTSHQIYKSNNETLRYSAVLDSRTCLSCGEYHGMIFTAATAPNLPFHHNCRCELIPESLFSDSDISSFSEWIETLSEDEKRDYLGNGRYELYKSGIPVTSFVDNGRILTLDELNNRGSE